VGVDLQSEHERYLTEKYAKKPVIAMNYSKAIKAFYMRLKDDGRTVASSLTLPASWGGRGRGPLAPGIGEIIGGSSRREERLEILDRNMAERGIDREHYAPTQPSPASGRAVRGNFPCKNNGLSSIV
jgi:asparaginyl-tRNA synthetase